jgi:hypothetical protein
VVAEEIKSAIETALRTPELLERAQAYHAEIASGVLSRNHDREPGKLRISDAGACSRELWAKMNGKLDLPEDPKSLLRMHNGSLMGAWMACVLKAGLEEDRPDLQIIAESEVAHDGIPGHVDVTVYRRPAKFLPAEATVEMKWSAWTGDWRSDCKPSHRIQSGKYALAEAAPQHFVVNYYAASPATIYVKDEGARIPGNYLVVHPFETDETAFDVAKEYDRLSAALNVEMPEPDPPEAYLCRSCRFSKCEKNPAYTAPGLLEKLEESYAKRNG